MAIFSMLNKNADNAYDLNEVKVLDSELLNNRPSIENKMKIEISHFGYVYDFIGERAVKSIYNEIANGADNNKKQSHQCLLHNAADYRHYARQYRREVLRGCQTSARKWPLAPWLYVKAAMYETGEVAIFRPISMQWKQN